MIRAIIAALIICESKLQNAIVFLNVSLIIKEIGTQITDVKFNIKIL